MTQALDRFSGPYIKPEREVALDQHANYSAPVCYVLALAHRVLSMGSVSMLYDMLATKLKHAWATREGVATITGHNEDKGCACERFLCIHPASQSTPSGS
ncbi:hypothetical protein [Xanthomonas euroxanthea]|uniref:hypothetical protein n=1 Tax=Xanthomonas euroxanthea TaxID=2259622 RepID=UPI001BAFF897|nr:hypothetical protein [Xanthomonas euroxanthea]